VEEGITPFDFDRMFLGDHPWAFTLEVVFRTVVMFVYTVGLVRMLGKRGMRQLSPFELVIIIALGSAVGDPMFYADVPLLHAMVVVTVVVLLVRGLALLTERSEPVERLVESEPTLLVRDGVILADALDGEHIAHDELLADLRESGFENLGDVRLAYLETSGNVSAFRRDAEDGQREGLSLLPDVPGLEVPQDWGECLACRRCGRLLEPEPEQEWCPHCERKGRMVRAVRRREPAVNAAASKHDSDKETAE